MVSFIKKVFIAILSFSSSLVCVAKVPTKCLSLNDKSCMDRRTLTDLNSVELKYHPFMISFDKYDGICDVFSPKNCVPKL